MESRLLKRVKKKWNRQNILKDMHYKLDMDEFVQVIYDICTPNKYGDAFPIKLQEDIGPKLGKMNRNFDRGDLHINYKTFFEAKISFLDKKGNYSITNIRDWQMLDYFILCFVDVNKDFKPKFYCVPKKTVTNNMRLNLTGMNNSKEVNKHNLYVGKRTSFSGDNVEWLFKESNVLNGTTYKHLLTFIKKQLN